MESIFIQHAFASTMARLSDASPSSSCTPSTTEIKSTLSPEASDSSQHLVDFASYCSAVASRFYNGFKDALVSIGNYVYNVATDLYCANLSQHDIQQVHYNFAKSLRSVSSFPSADCKEEAPFALLSRKQLVAILEKLHHANGADLNRLTKVVRNGSEQLSIEEWAYVSTMLDVISVDWRELLAVDFEDYRSAQAEYERKKQEHGTSARAKKKAADQFHFMSRQRFLLKNLDHLKRISRLQWAHGAHEVIITELENHYKPIWNQGYAGLTTYSASVGGAVGVSTLDLTAGINATGTIQTELFLDDERGTGELLLFNLGAAAEVKASLTPAVKAIGAISGTLTGGSYVEWNGPREYATNRFSTLITLAENQRNPKIARYLSRSSTLANSGFHPDITPDYAMWAVTRNEVADIDQLKSDYDLLRKDMEKQLSLLVSSTKIKGELDDDDETKCEIEYETQHAKPVKFNPINVSFVEALPSDTLAYEARVEGSVELGFNKIFTAGASASYTRKHFSLPDVKRTPLCERLFNPIKSKGKKAEERKWIVAQIGQQFDRFKNTLMESWKEIKYDASPASNLPQTRVGRGTPKQIQTFPALEISSIVIDSDPAFLLTPLKSQHKISDCLDFHEIETHFNYLKEDFRFLTQLHSRIASDHVKKGLKDQKDEKMLLAFVQRYGAGNTEQLLHRMVIANAYLFSKTDGNCSHLRDNMLAFEQVLLSPAFSVDQDYLRNHAYFEEDVLYEIIDNVYDIGLQLSSEFPMSMGGSFKSEIQDRERKFPNCLRDGYYLDFVFRLTEKFGDIKAVMNNIAPHVVANLSKESAKSVLDALETQLKRIAPTFEGDVEKVFQVRSYVPRDYADKLTLRHIFTRQAVNKEFKVGLEGAIPVGVANVTFGLGYSNLSTDCEMEVYASGTFFYFFMQNMREHYIELIDQKTGRISEKSYWHTIVKEQRNALNQLFSNYAAEQTGQDTSLSMEIEAIGEAIEANIHLTKYEKKHFFQASDAFKKAVVAFKDDNSQFDLTLNCFQDLMHAYYPHWNERYYNSALHQARTLSPLEAPLEE